MPAVLRVSSVHQPPRFPFSSPFSRPFSHKALFFIINDRCVYNAASESSRGMSETDEEYQERLKRLPVYVLLVCMRFLLLFTIYFTTYITAKAIQKVSATKPDLLQAREDLLSCQ